MAASAAALPPLESVPEAGGPTVPVLTVKDVVTFPLASVVWSESRGLEHETGICSTPRTRIVG